VFLGRRRRVEGWVGWERRADDPTLTSGASRMGWVGWERRPRVSVHFGGAFERCFRRWVFGACGVGAERVRELDEFGLAVL